MSTTPALKAAVLAAGQGKRIATDGSDLPKVMRLANGKPLIGYVLDAIGFIGKTDTVIVVGYKREQVIESFQGYKFAVQHEQLGTGHAVMAAYDELRDFDGDLLVCYGDMPLLRRETFQDLVEEHRSSANVCTMLTGTSHLDLPYGRVVRDSDGSFAKIVEDRDCDDEQKKITELNVGIYLFSAAPLKEILGELKNDNAQGEYYITDVPAIMKSKGMKVGICKRELGMELIGVNTTQQLKEVEDEIKNR